MKQTPQTAAIALMMLCSGAIGASIIESDFAEKLFQTANELSQNPQTAPAAEALGEAALRYAKEDPRLLRQSIDLQLQFGHREKAIELLNAYRKLEPNDQLAMVQTIDLLVEGMQSADERRKYMEQIATSEAVASEVRSHVCVQLYALLIETGDAAAAAKWLNQSILLNPVNPRALQLTLERLFATGGTAPQRTTAMVNLLKSNPMQPSTLATLAQELARAGATDEAVTMYRKAFDMNTALAVRPNADDVINYAALLLATDKPQEAASMATAATQLAPSSARAWFMRAMVEKQIGNDANLTAALAEAKSALTKNLMVLHRAIDKTAPEITEETPSAMPDVRADAKAIDAKSDLARMYAGALGDVAWLDSYFSAKAPDPAIIEALTTLTGDNSVAVTRLQGFAALGTGQIDEAQVKLSAIAERDSLARVGLLAVKLKKGEAKEALQSQANDLLKELPVDVWSATVRQTLRELAPIQFATDGKAEVIAESAKLPDQWLTFPKAANGFYLMELTPLKVGIQVGEPMLMKLRVQNTSNFPLVIGPGGVIDQSVAIDAQVRGPAEQYFPGTAIARITGDLVLQPRESVMTQVRIDSNELGNFLNASPHVALTIYASVVSNPRVVQQQNGPAILPGPGGFRQQGESVMDRVALPFAKDTVRQQFAKDLQNPAAEQRLYAYRAIAGNVQALLGVQQPTDQHRELAAAGQKMISEALANETDPVVKSQVSLLMLSYAGKPELIDAGLQAMVASSAWQERITAALIAINLPQAKRAELLKPLENDADDAIKKLVATIVTIPDPKPATQPAN